MRRYGAWVAILVLTLYLVLIGGSWFGLYSSDLRSFSVIAAAAVISVWLVVAWRQPEWRPRSVLLPAMAAALGSLVLSTLTSRFQRQSIEYLAYAVLLAALYLLLVRLLANPFFRARMSAAATTLCAIISLAYVWFVVSDWIRWWSLVGRVTVPPLRKPA